MIKINKILFPTDFSSCSKQALTHAIFFAKKYQAELYILHVITLFKGYPYNQPNDFPGIEEVQNKLSEIADVKMKEVINIHGSGALKIVKAEHQQGISETPVILDYADANDIDLIVMGTHGRRGLGHLFLGSVAEEVVRLSKCPVFTVRETKEPKQIKAFQKILVPIDFSDHSKEALSYAKEIANTYGAQLQLFHVIEETIHPAFSLSGKSSIFELVPGIAEDCRQRMEQMLKETEGPVVNSEIIVKGGHAANDIIKFTKDNLTDLIVIATHGLTGIEHFLLGSVTEKVVRMAQCPVFALKSFGKSLL